MDATRVVALHYSASRAAASAQTFPPNHDPMRTMSRFHLAVAASIGVAACQSAPSATPAQPAPAQPDPAAVTEAADPTTADGIYTAEQADRGEALFDGVCSECHDAADWTESGFKGRWESQSVFQLWYYINDRMPYDDPFSLSRQQVTDVLTYILELNGLPAGASELGVEDDDIDDFWIAWDASR